MAKVARNVGRVDVNALPVPIRQAFLALIRSIWDHGQLDGQLKEMIRVRSAVLANCRR